MDDMDRRVHAARGGPGRTARANRTARVKYAALPPTSSPAHLDEHDFRVMALQRCSRLGPLGLQLLAVATPGGVELQAEGRMEGVWRG